MRCEARYKGRTLYYSGVIARVHRDGSCDIDYDDGEKERMVEPSLIKVKGSGRDGRRGSSPSKRDVDGSRLEEGMKCEARYKGRSRYYSGVIARVHRDGSCDIDYDDGEKERMVEPSLIKVKERSKDGRRGSSPSKRDVDGSRLEEGMKCEARYKGRSRYYSGVIARVHRDGSCDIDYDDGEKERMVEPSLIKVKESSRNGRRGSSPSNCDVDSSRLDEGMKCEARYKGRSRYYSGVIARVHRDGSCDIDYDDGEKERMVEPSLIKIKEGSRDGRRGSSPSKRDVDSSRLEEGMRCEARYKGRSRYYSGVIARVHRDGSCDIDYDDGEKERMVEPSLIKVK
ncbi:unnamed protein product, partial [Chrysoparadoxa australica]